MRVLTTIIFLSLVQLVQGQTPGCTDQLASNFNAAATVNDGSCTYPQTTASPDTSFLLSDTLEESSGLLFWDGGLWTHNDNADSNLYRIDTNSGSILQIQSLGGAGGIDWEDITADSTYIYVGDFGNNSNGNRTNLHILRIRKDSLASGVPVVDTIFFSYADQVNFAGSGGNNTDYDCEAIIDDQDSFIVFTKQWVNNQTKVYKVPKLPGNHAVSAIDSFNVAGLITGACRYDSAQLVVLSGYDAAVQPFVFLLYDFPGDKFSAGNKRKINLSIPFHQVEGIETLDGLHYFVSNEYFSAGPIGNDQELHKLDLSPYLHGFLYGFPVGMQQMPNDIRIYPNPAIHKLQIETKVPGNFVIWDLNGRKMSSGSHDLQTSIDISALPTGNYILELQACKKSIRFIKE